MIEIKPMGRYYRTDPDGYLVNDTSWDLLTGKWRLAVEDAIAVCKTELGNQLRSLYARGSVPRGLGVEGISDLDLICLLRQPGIGVQRARANEIVADFLERHPFLDDLELAVMDAGTYLAYPQGPFTIKVRGLLLLGDDLAPDIGSYRPDKALARTLDYALEDSIRQTRQRLMRRADTEQRPQTVRWIAKRFLRTGMSTVLERAQTYSPDLWPQYECFSRFYPEKERAMYGMLELAINPRFDAEALLPALDDFGSWLDREYRAAIA